MGKIDLQQIIESGADFFVTGNEYVRDSLNLKFIPLERLNRSAYGGGSIIDLKFNPYVPDDIHGGGVILADANQDLAQSYSVAKNVFEHDESGLIKFVLIGLSPYILPQNNAESLVAWDVKKNAQLLEDYFKLCLDNGTKPVVIVLPVESSLKKTYNADVLKTFRDLINQVVKKFQSSAFIDLLDISIVNTCFQDKMNLNSEGAAAVSAFLSTRLYFKNIISAETICYMDNEYFEVLKKYFQNDYKKLMQHIFCRMACDDFNRLSKTMPKEDCMDLMARVFSEMTYNHLSNLSNMFSKDDYNDLADRIFKISAEKIRRKDKIKIGFYFDNTAKWCGDELYNFFVNDKRFEPTIFLYFSPSERTYEDFQKDLEKFKARGFNVIIYKKKAPFDSPQQDVLFQTSPYDWTIPPVFQLINLKTTTLLVDIPYSHTISNRKNFIHSTPLFSVLWKMFSPSKIALEYYQKSNKVGMPRGIFSGYPRMDIFFNKNIDFKFDWKMTRPDSKKIIWAPHHSVGDWKGSIHYSTFQWNYQFMYEFAKSHPEISWVVKPHPWLIARAVYAVHIFPSFAACQEYFQKWDDLPNAQVYTGPYYQGIFATSDGMIHDSGSFIAEYQYVDKPMIYLMRPEKKFNELGEEILKASYLVDGKDFDAIAAMMQRVFIEGDDYKAAERREVFDKYLNYPKYNGMLASEFIYKSIADDLKVVPT